MKSADLLWEAALANYVEQKSFDGMCRGQGRSLRLGAKVGFFSTLPESDFERQFKGIKQAYNPSIGRLGNAPPNERFLAAWRDDAPELDDTFFDKAKWYINGREVSRAEGEAAMAAEINKKDKI